MASNDEISNKLQIAGKVHKILPARYWKTREGVEHATYSFVLEYEKKFMGGMTINHAMFEVSETRWAELALSEGEEIVVNFEPDSSEYNGRWFNKLKAWRILRQQYMTFNGQRTTDNGQQTTDNGQHTTGNGQGTTDNGQQAMWNQLGHIQSNGTVINGGMEDVQAMMEAKKRGEQLQIQANNNQQGTDEDGLPF